METRLMKSLLNQADFCWSTQQICDQLSQLQNLRGEIFYPHVKFEMMDFDNENLPTNAKYDHTFMVTFLLLHE